LRHVQKIQLAVRDGLTPPDLFVDMKTALELVKELSDAQRDMGSRIGSGVQINGFYYEQFYDNSQCKQRRERERILCDELDATWSKLDKLELSDRTKNIHYAEIIQQALYDGIEPPALFVNMDVALPLIKRLTEAQKDSENKQCLIYDLLEIVCDDLEIVRDDVE